MADEFKIVASLDIPKSADKINKDIPKLEGQTKHLKIVATLNPALSLKNIQATLNKMNNNANIKIGIDTSGLNSVQGATQNITNGLKNVQTQAQQTSKAVNEISSNLMNYNTTLVSNTSFKAIKNEKEEIIDLEKTLENANKELSKFGKVDFSWTKDISGEIDSITAKITDATGVVEKYKYAFNDESYSFNWAGSVGTDSGVEKLIQSMQKAQDKIKALRTNLTTELKSIRSAWEDVNGGKSVKSEGNISNLEKQYIKTAQAIRELRNADDTTLASMKANANAQIDKLNQMVAQYHNAEKVATQLRAKGFETVKIDTGNNIDKFINSINNSKVPIQAMQTEINKLTSDFAQLDTIQDQAGKSAALTNILNTLDNAKTKFQSLKELFKGFGNAITELQGIANSAIFTKNASNPQVTQTKKEINSLITAYQNLETKLQGNITPAGLETVRTELTQLNARFNDATTTAKRFETELINANGAEQLAQKVKLLNERIKAYQSANPKAAKAFSKEFSDMTKTLSNPNIDLSSYNSVAKQLQIIKVRANEANLAGKTMWATFKEKLGKFTGWMSMTYAVSMFARSIRDALDELKEVDTILTEISKTSDRTEASLRKLGETSFATASKYGQKASDYLLGVQEMSRAGFDENSSEQMAELSTLAQSAGDMTAELANEYLIATNAGYQFGGSAEKLNSVLDSQNYITNHNALSMSELAEATKIVSSQSAQAGIGIDKMTAAVGTMIATTQQGGEVAARAFRGILMNLQQVKGTAEDIGDGGEDITTESLTKYEKACADLGVSLKEVKDGVLQLRDPMVILEELANAVSKEAEGSIKVANLISAVGGKICLVT